MRDQIGRQIDSSVCSFSKNIVQLVSFAQDPGHFALNVNILTICIHIIGWIRRPSSFLRSMSTPGLSTMMIMLSCRNAGSAGDGGVVLSSWLDVCINRIILLLPVQPHLRCILAIRLLEQLLLRWLLSSCTLILLGLYLLLLSVCIHFLI